MVHLLYPFSLTKTLASVAQTKCKCALPSESSRARGGAGTEVWLLGSSTFNHNRRPVKSVAFLPFWVWKVMLNRIQGHPPGWAKLPGMFSAHWASLDFPPRGLVTVARMRLGGSAI